MLTYEEALKDLVDYSRTIERLRAASQKVVDAYLSPGSIGSRVEVAIYELRDALKK